jgi:hypothetical protein
MRMCSACKGVQNSVRYFWGHRQGPILVHDLLGVPEKMRDIPQATLTRCRVRRQMPEQSGPPMHSAHASMAMTSGSIDKMSSGFRRS